MRREFLKRALHMILALILCIEALTPLRAQAADAYSPAAVSGSMTAETVQAWTMDALDRGAMQVLLNRQTLHPQRTGWVELDNKIGELLSHAGSSAYDKLWYAYDWLVKNITYSWAGYTTAQLPGHYYDRFEWDYLKNLTYEPGLRKSVPDDMANRAYHVLTAKKGVCYDFAITIAVIARYIGLESYVHLGDFQWEYEDKDTSYHGWAVLVLDGGKYVFDAQRDSRYWSEYKRNPGYYFGIPEAKAWRYAPNKYEEDRIGNAKRDAQMLPLTAARKTRYTITVKSSGSGTVSGGGQYDAGASVALRASPASGHSFEGWYKYDGKKISTSNPYSITAGADRTYTALFSGDYFIDVPADAWYRDTAVQSAKMGLVKGNGSPVIFDGNGIFSRAMAVTLIARMAGADVKSSPKAPFKDVPSGTWYCDYVNWAFANGVAVGISRTEFAPDRPVTRQEFMTMLERYIAARGIPVTGRGLPFRDADSTAGWARASVERFYARGLVKGDGTGRLLPTRELTRSEGATFVVRTAEYLKAHGA